MQCLKVNPENGSYSINRYKFSFDENSERFLINGETVKTQTPIGLQLFNNYLYIYLNPETIIVTSNKSYNQLIELLRNHRIPSLKVPQKQTQVAASQQQQTQQNLFVHCGTFDFQHNCFIVVRFCDNPVIIVKDKHKNILFQRKCLNQSNKLEVIFHDQQKRITLTFNNFYFWNQFQYFNLKYQILNYCDKENIERNNPSHVQSNKMMQQEYEKDENQNYEPIYYKIVQQKEQKVSSGRKNNKIYQQNTTGRKKSNRMRQQSQQEQSQMGEDKNDQSQNIKSRLRASTLNNFKSYSGRKRNQEDQKSQMNSVSNNQLRVEKYNQVMTRSKIKKALEFKLQVCCLYDQNVLDIKQKQGKSYLFYHEFQLSNSFQAVTKQLCVLQHFDEQGEYKIKPNKLVYDIQSQSAFYNDENREYIHSFNIKKNKQESYNVKYPVLDFVRNNNSSLLGVHKDTIFQFDTRKKIRNQIEVYKTVNNLSKISAAFGKNYYVTASSDGFVRTYDIRNNIKALNKFQMQPGITSLHLSDTASYILCCYGNKAQIISCYDRNDESVFGSRILKTDRKEAKNLVQGYENLSHIQFLNGNQNQGDIIAVDDKNPCNLIIKNIQLTTSQKSFPLQYGCNEIEYLDCYKNWIVYGKRGSYFRQQVPWVIKK